jgi:hypothetical protein
MVRKSLIITLLLVLLLAYIVIPASIANSKISQSENRLQRANQQIESLSMDFSLDTQDFTDQISIQKDIYDSFLISEFPSSIEFAQVVENMVRRSRNELRSLQPGESVFSQVFDGEMLSLLKRTPLQMQLRGDLTGFLRLLYIIETEFPWIHVDRLSYRPLSAENANQMQIDLLLTFYVLESPNDAPLSTTLFSTADDTDSAVIEYNSRIEQILYLPLQETADFDTSSQNSEPPLFSEIEESETYLVLGSVIESGRRLYSLKHILNGRVFVLGVGESEGGFSIIEDNETTLVIEEDGKKWFVNK